MTKTVLVIEDDRSVARLLQDVLESRGFQVLAEHDGEWGLRTFQEKPVDLVITDVLIPKVKGFELIARIRETEKGQLVPIIVISGIYQASLHADRLLADRAVLAYLDKPLDIDRLVTVLGDVFTIAPPQLSAPAVTLAASAEAPGSVTGNGVAAASPSPVAPVPTPPGFDGRTGARSSLPPTAFAGVDLAPGGEPVSGDLAEVPFARLLGGLFAARVTGGLLLRRGAIKKIVYLRQGVPVFVKSNLLHECLGRIMVAERLISPEECDRSLELKRRQQKKQGEVLVEMGSISPHNLAFALELQLQQKLLDLFGWRDGAFHLNVQDTYEGPQVALAMAPAVLVYEGASRGMSDARIRAGLARIEAYPVVPAPDPTFRYQALELEPRAGPLLDRIDGHQTLRALLDTPGLDPAAAARLLYALACTSLMRVHAPAAHLTGDLQLGALGPLLAPGAANARTEIEAPSNLPGIEHRSTGGTSADDLRSMLFEHTPPLEGRRSLEAADFERTSVTPLPHVDDALLDDAGAFDQENLQAGPLPTEPPAVAKLADVADRPGASGFDGASEASDEREAADRDGGAPELGAAASDLLLSHEISDPDTDVVPLQTLRGADSREAAEAAGATEAVEPAEGGSTPPLSFANAGESDTDEVEPMPPPLSDDLRRQVRARLEADMARVAAERMSQRSVAQALGVASKAPAKPAPVVKPPPKDPAQAARDARLEGELEARLAALASKNAYERLGLEPTATPKAVRAQVDQLLAEHDPDRIAPEPTSARARALAERVWLELARARDQLVEPAVRRRYDQSLGDGADPRRIAPILLAEQLHQRGRRALEAGAFSEAAALFRQASEQNQDEGVYLAYLADATYRAAPEQSSAVASALELFAQAIERAPRSDEVYLLRGLVHRALDRKVEALSDLEEALRLNPEARAAQDALRALEPATARKGSIFSRLIELD